MDWKKKWSEWQAVQHSNAYITEDLNKLTDATAREQFENHLEFGTGGARGIIGAGINRINHYTVRRITQGLLNYLSQNIESAKEKGIAISYDTRHYSKEFAENVAYLAAEQGFKVFLSDEPRPTPLLSYMVRQFNAAGGVMITASHNPPEYNGYKIYDHTGGQMTELMAKLIEQELLGIDNELDLPFGSLDSFILNDTILMADEKIDESYLKDIKDYLKEPDLFNESTDFNVVYSPLHGAGLSIIKKAFKSLGYDKYSVVEEQTTVSGDFETVKSPNPEDKEAFTYAEALGKKENANLIMATDPDADRLGVAVYDKDEYIYLNGNQLGSILLNYLIENNKNRLKNTILIKTIVTSELGAKIAEKHEVEVINTLTGFKYIGEQITNMESIGEKQFLFGYEESYGYLFSPIVRDKDAVQSVILLIEAALFYHKRGRTLLDVLNELYSEYGHYSDELVTIKIESAEQFKEIQSKTVQLKSMDNEFVKTYNLKSMEDFSESMRMFKDGKNSHIDLPKSNVLKLRFEDESWLAIRPSGTEPKYKFYFSTHENSKEESERRLKELKTALFDYLSI